MTRSNRAKKSIPVQILTGETLAAVKGGCFPPIGSSQPALGCFPPIGSTPTVG